MTSATARSPSDGHTRRQQAERRLVESHPADVDREQRSHERGEPRDIEQHAVLLFDLHARADFRHPRIVSEPEVGNDRVVGFAPGEGRRRCDVERRAEDPDARRDGDRPVDRRTAEHQEEQHDGEISGRGKRVAWNPGCVGPSRKAMAAWRTPSMAKLTPTNSTSAGGRQATAR